MKKIAYIVYWTLEGWLPLAKKDTSILVATIVLLPLMKIIHLLFDLKAMIVFMLVFQVGFYFLFDSAFANIDKTVNPHYSPKRKLFGLCVIHILFLLAIASLFI